MFALDPMKNTAKGKSSLELYNSICNNVSND